MSKTPKQDDKPRDSHDQRRRKRQDVGPSKMQLNLTSMIDVIFQLLIYFVVTASFTPDEGIISTKLPALQGQGMVATLEPPKRPLDIVVRDVGHYECQLLIEQDRDRVPHDFVELTQILRDLQYSDANPQGVYPDDTPVLIKPGATAAWQHVVNAFNAAVAAKYRNVSFARVEDEKP